MSIDYRSIGRRIKAARTRLDMTHLSLEYSSLKQFRQSLWLTDIFFVNMLYFLYRLC